MKEKKDLNDQIVKDREENTKIIEENKFKKKNGKSSITAHGVWIYVYRST